MTPPESNPSAPVSVTPRARVVIAWLVILAASATIYAINVRGSRSTGGVSAQNMMQDLQSRYIVGASQFPGAGAGLHQSLQDSLNPENSLEVLRSTVLSAELVGPRQGLTELDLLKTRWDTGSPKPTDAEVQLADTLGQLYEARLSDDFATRGWTGPPVAELEQQLGWLGRLAVNPAKGPDESARSALLDEASRTAFVLIGVALVALAGFVFGLGLLGVWLVLAWQRTVKFRLKLGSSTGGYYAETFALWFVTFFVLNMAFVQITSRRFSLISAGLASAASLLTLWWPVAMRGVPWHQVRQEIGLYWPQGAWREVLTGGLSYVAGLPLVAVGMLLTLALMKLHNVGNLTAVWAFAESPVHPIIEPLARGTPFDRLQAVAVVLLVPITEEIMFRGVLYRHLREASRGWGVALSVVFSVLFNAFLFAIIHPQGLLGVPLLMSIAIVLAVAREWRGALLAPIVTHMIVNGVTTSIVLLAFR